MIPLSKGGKGNLYFLSLLAEAHLTIPIRVKDIIKMIALAIKCRRMLYHMKCRISIIDRPPASLSATIFDLVFIHPCLRARVSHHHKRDTVCASDGKPVMRILPSGIPAGIEGRIDPVVAISVGSAHLHRPLGIILPGGMDK